MKLHIGDLVSVETATSNYEGAVLMGFDARGWPTTELGTEIDLDDEFTVGAKGKGWRIQGWLLSVDDIEVIKPWSER